MKPIYLLCPGPVPDAVTGTWGRIGAAHLARLYGVTLADCLILPERSTDPQRNLWRDALLARRDLAQLWPRNDGVYSLPGAAGAAGAGAGAGPDMVNPISPVAWSRYNPDRLI